MFTKSARILGLAAALLLLGAVTPVRAEPIAGTGTGIPDPTFDENGHHDGGFTSFTYGPDVSGGVGGPVLTYYLPFLVVPGNARIFEPDGVTLSDVLRFTDANGTQDPFGLADRMIFYSADIGGGALADSGLPGNVAQFNDGGGAIEDALGNFNYFGYVGQSSPNGVPEPASLTLLGMGITGIAGYVLRQRKRRPLAA